MSDVPPKYEPKFKAGDRVRYVGNNSHNTITHILLNQEGVAGGVDPQFPDATLVKWDNPVSYNGKSVMTCNLFLIEPVAPRSRTTRLLLPSIASSANVSSRSGLCSKPMASPPTILWVPT